MKKILIKILPIALLAVLFSGCVNSPVSGTLYTNINHSGPGDAGIVDNNVNSTKVGVSKCVGILNAIAFGDCSVNEAKADGQITKVASVEHESMSILFFYDSYITIVHGE